MIEIDLVIRYLEGIATDEEVGRLDAWIAESPANAQFLARYALDSKSLNTIFKHEAAGSIFIKETGLSEKELTAIIMSDMVDEALECRRITDLRNRAAEMLLADQARLADEARVDRLRLAQEKDDRPTKINIIIPKIVAALGAAAVVGIVVWLGLAVSQANKEKEIAGTPDSETQIVTPPQPVNVALVRSSVNARWMGREVGHDHLQIDSTVELAGGLAEVVFGDGTTVIIQGPAAFAPTGSNSMRLDYGRIVATVPVSGHGFTVATDNGLITDYGTEFGVLVNEGGHVLAQTFSGRIGFKPLGSDNELQVLAGEAIEGDTRGNVREIEPDELAFVGNEEFEARRDADSSAYARWLASSYDLRRDSSVVAYYIFDARDAEQGVLNNYARGGGDIHGQLGNGSEIAAPSWVDGRFDQAHALRFGDAGSRRTYGVVVPDSNALDLDEEMTFALWVRATDPQKFYGTLLSKRESPPRYMNYQIALMSGWRSGGQEFQFGSGQDDASLGSFVYSRASRILTTEQWHHVVITTDGQSIRYFVDGNRVHTAQQRMPAITNNSSLLIGTSAVGGGQNFFDHAVPFHGDISEVLIAKRAFTDQEIHDLYRNGGGSF